MPVDTKRCPDCGGPLAVGEGHAVCALCGHVGDAEPQTEGTSRKLARALDRDAVEVVPMLIRRHAEIDDELESRGANALVAERERVRELLKDAMVRADVLVAADEQSGYRARIKPTKTDTYPSLERLARALPRPEMIDECTELVARPEVIRRWVLEGLVTWTQLQISGALVRKVRSRALYVEPISGDSKRRNSR